MKARQKRMVFVGVGIAASLALSALQSDIAYFFSPVQAMANEHPADAVLAKHDESCMPPEVADTLQTAHVEGVTESAAQSQQAGGVAQ